MRHNTLGWFGKKKSDDGGETGPKDGETRSSGSDTAKSVPKSKSASAKAVFERDPRKARRFIEYARTVADSRNYDYAIECYINGLRHDPENIDVHQALYEVAIRRLVAGGKPAGFKDKIQHSGGKTDVEKMLNTEFVWAKDPRNAQQGLMVMDLAMKAEVFEVAHWIGQFVLEANDASKRPSRTIYTKVKDHYKEMQAWEKAVEAMMRITRMEPGNMALIQEQKQLEAELTVLRGGYDQGKSIHEAGGIKDVEKQKALEAQDAIAGTDSQIETTINRLRDEYESNLEDIDKLGKLIRAMLRKEDDATENDAIKLLNEAHERTGQYRLRVQVGDIRMRQYNRRLRVLRQAASQAQGDDKRHEIAEQFQKVRMEQLQYELHEYAERAKNYPTQMELKFNLGVRQFMLGDLDASIASFQEAQADPKYRAQALRYLGEAFFRKDWYDEAVDCFHRGIEVHQYNDDKLALELRYHLMLSLTAKSKRDKDLDGAMEAAKVASQIAQADINYKDIRTRMEDLRKLITELRG